jgi:hypothetical protein
VHKSLKTHGDFAIENKTSTQQQIQVNLRDFTLAPGEVLTLRLPVGTVSTRLPGRELKNWTLAAPDYQERINIEPLSQPVTTLRPTVVYSPPTISTSPPVWTYTVPIVEYYLW